MITADQCRMGRAALNWTARDLADAAKVGINTVTRFEAGAEALMSTAEKLQRALEKAGVEFIAADGGGPGVRLKKRKR
jgi:transcriptional regulator with XRE-family HTH domain